MYCLRCGQETIDDQAFCLDCQKQMAKYPVDPSAVVQLPPRKPVAPKKAAKRRITPEEQIRQLKKRVRLYACLFAAALIAVLCLAVPVIRDYGKTKFKIGQNYSTSTVKTETTPQESVDMGE